MKSMSRSIALAERAGGVNGRKQSEKEGDYMKYPLSSSAKYQQVMLLRVAISFLNSLVV